MFQTTFLNTPPCSIQGQCSSNASDRAASATKNAEQNEQSIGIDQTDTSFYGSSTPMSKTKQQSSSKQGFLSSLTIAPEGPLHAYEHQSSQPYPQQDHDDQNLTHDRSISPTSLVPYINAFTLYDIATFHSVINPESHRGDAAVTTALVAQPSVTQSASPLDNPFHLGDDMMDFMSLESAPDLLQYSFGLPTSTSISRSWMDCMDLNCDNTFIFRPSLTHSPADQMEGFIDNPTIVESGIQAFQTDVRSSLKFRAQTGKKKQRRRVCDGCHNRKVKCIGNRDNFNTCSKTGVKCENIRPVRERKSKARKLASA